MAGKEAKSAAAARRPAHYEEQQNWGGAEAAATLARKGGRTKGRLLSLVGGTQQPKKQLVGQLAQQFAPGRRPPR